MEQKCSYSVHKYIVLFVHKPFKTELKQLDKIDQISETISNTDLLCSESCSRSIVG